jgi:hypothetical protein
MANSRNRHEARLQALIKTARDKNIEVRMEKLLREVGYRARSGCCRINGRAVIILDRDASVSDQVDFLLSVLAQQKTTDLFDGHSGENGNIAPASG